MAKHPHKLMLVNNRTWRCVLDGCAFFVHLGLAHVIIGKRLICWKCEETFIVHNDLSTGESRPTCNICRTGIDVPSPMDLDAYIQERIEQNKTTATGDTHSEDQIEVIEEDEVHSPDCELHAGGECSCGGWFIPSK